MDSFFWFHIEVEDLNGICLLPSSSGRGCRRVQHNRPETEFIDLLLAKDQKPTRASCLTHLSSSYILVLFEAHLTLVSSVVQLHHTFFGYSG